MIQQDTPFNRTSAAHPLIRQTPQKGKGRLLPEARSSAEREVQEVAQIIALPGQPNLAMRVLTLEGIVADLQERLDHGTRTVLVCSSSPRGSAAAAGGGTAPRNPPLRWRGPQGTRNDPDNFGSAAGAFTQAFGGWAGSKLERVEFPAGGAG